MNFFGSPEEHFHGRDCFKNAFWEYRTQRTKKKKKKAVETEPKSVNNSRNQNLLMLVPSS